MRRGMVLGTALALLLTGCAQAPAEETPVRSLSPVYTDWSGLTPYQPPRDQYTRRYETYTDTLIPAGDYGPLIPFAGAVCTRTEGLRWTEDYQLYGLVTLEGEVVTDPVFSNAFPIVSYRGRRETTGALLLNRTFTGPDGQPEARAAVCAGDGSWCTGFLYTYNWEYLSCGDLSRGIPLQKGETQFVFVDPKTGEELRVVDTAPARAVGVYPDELFWRLAPGEDFAGFSTWGEDGLERYFVYDLNEGTVTPAAGDTEYAGIFSEGLCAARNSGGLWGYLDGQGRWAIDPEYDEACDFQNGGAVVRKGERWMVLNRDGSARLTLPEGCALEWNNDTAWAFFDRDAEGGGNAVLLDENYQVIPIPEGAEPSCLSYTGGGGIFWREGEEWVVLSGGERRTSSCPGTPADAWGNYVLQDDGHGTWYLVDLDTGAVRTFEGVSYMMFQLDTVTGEPYLWLSREENGGWELWDLEGNLLARQDYDSTGSVEMAGGLVARREKDRFTLTTPGGETVFSWSVASPED